MNRKELIQWALAVVLVNAAEGTVSMMTNTECNP
jgi:hypothetical protein